MIAVLSWWLALELFGLLALPLAWRLFARLPGRGYPQAKALGLLLASYLLWLGASFHLLPNDIGGILAAVLLLAVLSFWLGRPALRRATAEPGAPVPLFQWLKDNRALVIVTEVLFLVVLAAWAIFRAYSGEISATEKPMEFAFINGVLNSRYFPPQDPWLSGYAISYYYFGYVMLALLIRLTGVLPSVGFNLGVAAWYALALTGAFGVVYDLVRLAAGRRAATVGQGEEASEGDSARPGLRALRWGVLGALFMGVFGNLEGLLEAGYNAGWLPQRFVQWIDIKDLTTNPPTGNLVGTGWWWWHASRVIHDKDLLGASVEVIDEFPFFSFLLGDLHPHVLALPFVLLAIALALALLRAAAQDGPALLASAVAPHPGPARLGLVSGDIEQEAAELPNRAAALRRQAAALWRELGDLTGLGTPGVLLYGLALGGLSFLNTWDFPIYLALVSLAFGVGLARRRGLSWPVFARTAAVAITFGALGWLAYLPFYLGFQSQAGGVLPNLLFPTRLSQFLVMFGLFLSVAVFFLALLTREVRTDGPRLADRFLTLVPWTVLLPVLFLALLMALAALLPQGRAVVQNVLDNPAVRSRLPEVTLGPLLGLIARVRMATPWTYLFLALMIAWSAAVLWKDLAAPQPGAPASIGRTGLQPADLFAVLMILLALLLTFSVEFVYLKDYFGTRMNTVFKFYYQAWVLLALAAAYGLSRLAERSAPLALGVPALLLAILLGAASLFYPLLATPSKAGDFQGRPTLDGLAYMRETAPGDAAAIDWLRHNVSPTAVVLEATGGSYSPEGAERVSMSTGNPTLLGWDFHEMQWRGKAYDDLAGGHKEAIDAIYRTSGPSEIRSLLERWHVDYVYIGGLERQKYGISEPALARFDRAGLRKVYDAQGVRIYAH